MDNDDDYFESLKDATDDGALGYVDLPIGRSLKEGELIAYLFTTGWEIGKVRDPKKMSRRQKREANEMETPVLVWYEDDKESWVHDLWNGSKYLARADYDILVNQPPDQHPTLEAGVWCIVSVEK